VPVAADKKAFRAFLRTLFREDWVVYAKPPFGGPEHVLQYLARYTHRVAISNHRLLSVDDDHVTFRWKDYARHSKCRAMTLTLEEFLRRFLQHVLPKGLPRIRYFGWLANRRRRKLLPHCRSLLAVAPPVAETNLIETALWRCPACSSPMRVVERLTAARAGALPDKALAFYAKWHRGTLSAAHSSIISIASTSTTPEMPEFQRRRMTRTGALIENRSETRISQLLS
jgi:hypothetical protein